MAGIVVILVNGSEKGRGIHYYSSHRARFPDQPVIQIYAADHQRQQILVQATFEDEIVDIPWRSGSAALSNTRHQLILPVFVAEIQRVGDINIPPPADHQERHATVTRDGRAR